MFCDIATRDFPFLSDIWRRDEVYIKYRRVHKYPYTKYRSVIPCLILRMSRAFRGYCAVFSEAQKGHWQALGTTQIQKGHSLSSGSRSRLIFKIDPSEICLTYEDFSLRASYLDGTSQRQAADRRCVAFRDSAS